MCSENHCTHGLESLCTCEPVREGDSFRMAVHLAENMTDVDWRLTYNSLMDINPYQLCMVGKCGICGGRLCIELKPFGNIITDDFLAGAYRHLYQFHFNLAQHLPHKAFRDKFVEMFRQEDRTTIEKWLARPENQTVHTMYRRSKKKVYTIVHTRADAGKVDFPLPEGKGSYLTLEKAKAEMAVMVALEKEDMQFPFASELYREEYGDGFWEASCDGYAAGWFVRYDIIESPLILSDEKGKCDLEDSME